jgi:YhcN/YlaJ family sporulation lipoprotein
MPYKRKRYLIIVSALLGAIFVFQALAGCGALRRPAPAEDLPGAPPGGRQVLPTDPRESAQLADRLARVAAETPGVNRATVVLVGTTAYLGLNLEAEMDEEQTETTKRKAAKRIKDEEPRIERVMVVTDVDTLTRLENMAEGVRRGKPVSAFTDELAEINRRASPITD